MELAWYKFTWLSLAFALQVLSHANTIGSVVQHLWMEATVFSVFSYHYLPSKGKILRHECSWIKDAVQHMNRTCQSLFTSSSLCPSCSLAAELGNYHNQIAHECSSSFHLTVHYFARPNHGQHLCRWPCEKPWPANPHQAQRRQLVPRKVRIHDLRLQCCCTSRLTWFYATLWIVSRTLRTIFPLTCVESLRYMEDHAFTWRWQFQCHVWCVTSW